MSGKKAKEKRKQEKEGPHPNEKPLVEYKTAYFKNGDVRVTMGFPANYDMAMTIAHASAKCIMDFFLNKAKEGKIDINNNVIKTHIIAPSGDMINAKAMADFMNDVKKNGS